MERLMIAALGVLVLGASCGGPGRYELAGRADELAPRVKQYHDLYRWRDYQAAAELVLPSVRPGFLDYASRLKPGYIVEGYTINDIGVDATGERAAVTLRRSYINPPSVTLQNEELRQEWVYDRGAWFLAGPPF